MQNLREQLLKAGLISKDQHQRAERGGKPSQAEKRATKTPEPSKPSRKALAKQPLNRMIDLSDPRVLKIFQAIEAHRVREETRGDVPFHFTLRDGRVRKISITQAIADGLEASAYAIVESGEEDRHVIVASAAVPLIREADPEAVRFVNEPA